MEPRTSARDAEAWRKWLERNHASAREIWLVFWRKHSGRACVGYEEAVEEAICFGWIDGIKKRVDGDRHAYRFSPRRPGSRWSRINRKRAEALLAAGRMAAAGLAAVEEGRRRGTWAAAKVKRPDHMSDLLRAVLAGEPRAAAAIASESRIAVLFPVEAGGKSPWHGSCSSEASMLEGTRRSGPASSPRTWRNSMSST